MKRNSKKKKPRNKFETGVFAAESLLKEGLVLAVDPSIGSQSSMPAYALSDKGTILHSGVIELDIKMPPHRRLHHLQTELFSIAPSVDVLIIENIPPFMQSRGSSFRSQATVSLHWAVGAILASYDVEHLIQVAPVTWHNWVKAHCPGYVKSDEHDALVMLTAALHTAGVGPTNMKDVLEVLREE